MNKISQHPSYLQLSHPQIYDGSYREDIFHHITNRLDWMISRHNKVLVIRFDVRYPDGYPHDGRNTQLSNFLRRLRENIEYSGCRVQYVWAREQVSSPVPHYHVMLIIDGSKVQNPMGILHEADRIWAYMLGHTGTGLVHFCQQDGSVGHVMIRRPSSVAEGNDLFVQQRQFGEAYNDAIGKGAYLAKTYSKGGAPSRVREYGCSQMG